uniref:PDZ domain-containing protein n=1 Tax=Setaria digitata TaxID=48799 RepID=A0A915PC83_9BILA
MWRKKLELLHISNCEQRDWSSFTTSPPRSVPSNLHTAIRMRVCMCVCACAETQGQVLISTAWSVPATWCRASRPRCCKVRRSIDRSAHCIRDLPVVVADYSRSTCRNGVTVMYHTMSITTDTAAISSTGPVHCQQGANYVTPPEHYVFVHRVECMRDGGILDPDDQLFDVFDENKDQILAIYDEPDCSIPNSASVSRFPVSGTMSSASSSTTSKTIASLAESPLDGKLNVISSSSDGDVVEITNIAVPPTDGLRVISDNAHTLQQKPSSSSIITGCESVSPSTPSTAYFNQKPTGTSNACRAYHSALKSVNGSPRSKYRVTISPDVSREPLQESSIFMKELLMTRTSARKSRLTDNFFDAKERLEEKLAGGVNVKADKKDLKLIPLMEAANRRQTVIVLSDSTVNRQLGIEISPVHDLANSMRLQAVEIRQIDEEGRIGIDGRLWIGDRIVEINQRPVYQMSISRARAYLHEMQAVSHPSLTIDRPIETFANDLVSHRSQSSTSSLQKRPILSALQQANTTALGATFPVEIVKIVYNVGSGGFGFTITSRETAKGERLFYIGTVKADGAAASKLRAGDRLLQINNEKTSELTQNDMVERLKKLDVGDSVNLLVSRLGNQENEIQSPTVIKDSHNSKVYCHQESENREERYREEILTLKIALNETGSAGLGISLKARAVMKPDGTRRDCGIFIKKVLHGGAAYKDGRLQLNDQLIGIEDIDLRRMTKNSEASDAITRCLKNLGPTACSVCLRVARKLELHSNDSSSVRSSIDESLISNCDSSKTQDESRTNHANEQEMSNALNPNVVRQDFGSSGDRSANGNEDLDLITSDRQKCVSEDEISHVDANAFNRENPARRSISEKRHMGNRGDANSTVLFQKIKHNRQMSAPLLQRLLSPTTQQSVMMPSAYSATSLREKCRRRSLTFVRPSLERDVLGMPAGNREAIVPIPSTSSVKNKSITEALSLPSPNRRSLSLESIEAHRSQASSAIPVYPNEPAFRDPRVEQVTRRGHPSALKRAQKSRPNGYTKFSVSDAEDQTSTGKGRDESYASLPREISAISKEKQQRRKSVGSSIFSKITQKFGGSRSRDASPEKSVSFDIAERTFFSEKANRTQDHREWNKEGNQLMRRAAPSYKPTSCDALQSADSNYYANDVPGTHKTEIACCSGEELPAGCCIRVANSKFYNSFLERNKDYPTVHHSIGGDNIKEQFSTKNAVVRKDEIHTSFIKEDCIGCANELYVQSQHYRHQQQQQFTVQPPGCYEGRQEQQQLSYYAGCNTDYYDAFNACTLIFPQQRRQAEEQCAKFTTKDSDLAQLSYPQQEYERGRASKDPVPTTQAVMCPVPVVFPTSRTFFLAPSARPAKHRANDSQVKTQLSLRSRPKSVFIRPSKGYTLSGSGTSRPSSLKRETFVFSNEHFFQNEQQQLSRNPDFGEPLAVYSDQSKQKQFSGVANKFAPSISHPETSVPSVPYQTYPVDEATLSSSTYLQTLLESPTKNHKDAGVVNIPKPIKCIKIHYGPSHPSYSKQQPLRARSMDIRPSNSGSFQQEQQETNDFDYRKYLRSTRRGRINAQEQRVTLIATVPDETIMKETATCYASRPSTIYKVTNNS